MEKPSKRIGTTVAGRYCLTSLMGIGGAGAVYEAEHLVTKRVVAVKLLRQDRNVPASAAARFVREARAAAQIGHECIIDVLDAGQDEDGTHFIVMERLRGEDLAEHLERVGRLSIEETVDRVSDLLEALAAAHEAGIVHRDIKPGNIFLSKTHGGRPRTIVLDFGIAKQNDGDTTGITKKGMLVGTPVYMSPEQVRADGPPDLRSDIWAVGVLLYQCLSGELPFDDPNIHKLWVAIVRDPHVPLAERAPDVPAAVSQVVDRALSKDPDARFSSAHGMRDALLRAAGRPQDVGRVRRTTQRRAVDPDLAGDDEAPTWDRGPGGSGPVWLRVGGLALAVVVAGVLWMGPAEPDTISLTFKGLPDNARAFVDGQEVDIDGVRWAAGQTSITIAAEAPGYERRQLLVTPDANKTVRLTLTPVTPSAAAAASASASASAPMPAPAPTSAAAPAARPAAGTRPELAADTLPPVEEAPRDAVTRVAARPQGKTAARAAAPPRRVRMKPAPRLVVEPAPATARKRPATGLLLAGDDE